CDSLFFFQAEDGIRDLIVTGVQTCALPIYHLVGAEVAKSLVGADKVIRDLPPSMGAEDFSFMLQTKPGAYLRIGQGGDASCFLRSEERRVGKEGRSRVARAYEEKIDKVS